MTQITPIPINQLPAATTLTGNEPMAVFQAGRACQAPVSSLPQGSEAGVVVYGNTGGAPFPNYRTLTVDSPLILTDGGPQADLRISVNGAVSNYDPAHVAITGGTIDGAVIGNNSPADGTFDALTVNDFAHIGTSHTNSVWLLGNGVGPAQILFDGPGNPGGTFNVTGASSVYNFAINSSTVGRLDASGINIPIGATTPNAGTFTTLSADNFYPTLVANTTFNSAVAHLTLAADYLFGSSAVAGPGQTAITNSTILGTYFQNHQDFTGSVRVNSELETYELFATAANYVFNSNNLQITGTLDGGGAVAPFLAFLNNSYAGATASFTPANIGRADETGFAVGRIMITTFFGYNVITGITGTGSGAVITATRIMGTSATTFLAFCPIQIMPYCYTTLNSNANTGDTVLHFAAVPADVYDGMFIGMENGNGYQAQTTYVIQSHTGTTVTISPALNAADAFASGRGVVFMPPIRSGQIVTKNKFPIPGNGATYFAMELTCQLPQNAIPYFDPANAAANGSYGAWPAWWVYGGNAGGSYADASEIDNFEFYNQLILSMKNYQTNVVLSNSGMSNTPSYLYHPSSWTSYPWSFASSTYYSAAVHKFQLLMTPTMVYSFIDGLLMKSTPFVWTSEKQLQVLCNLAIGSLAQGLGTNNLWPTATSNFASLHTNIYEIKFWSV